MTAVIGNIIASAIVVGLVALSVRTLRKEGSGCSGHCAGCGGSCSGCKH